MNRKEQKKNGVTNGHKKRRVKKRPITQEKKSVTFGDPGLEGERESKTRGEGGKKNLSTERVRVDFPRTA